MFALKNWRVLAVDDDRESLAAFSMLLTLEGAQVDTADDTESALLLTRAKTYDLLISDLRMPGRDGLSFIAEVRTFPEQRALRAIAVSGYGSEGDIRRSINAGFDAHITKPLTLERLKHTLAGLVPPATAPQDA